MELKIIEISLLMLAVFGMLFLFLKRYRGRILPGNGLVDMVHYHPFGPKKGIAVVKLGEGYFVLGVTEQNISLITELDKSAVPESTVRVKGKNRVKKQLNFRQIIKSVLSVLLALVCFPALSHAAADPTLIGGALMGFASPIELLMFFTLLSLLPAILIMCTSFTRIVVVLSFLRQALGTPQVPPTQVIIGLSLFITLFVMSPVLGPVYNDAYLPMRSKKISTEKAFQLASVPLKKFMLKQTSEKDIALFLKMSKNKKPKTPMELKMSVVIPAFAIGELKKAFQIGFLIFLPFVVIDMIIASILLSLGMMMLPPVMISMPFKLLLFVLVNGWDLVVVSLVRGFM